ncbi:ribbon-helix-helix protein, CopG family [Candidatus Pacearchaeota archaeon]|nr:ribbon-helix-helix protein, CopG family [Candidatus Pacearchaeota archaeon]
MKKRISATIDDKTDKILDNILKSGDYRNKSHIVEKAIEYFWEAKKDDKKNK